MRVKNTNRFEREAFVIADRDGVVLYNALEKGKVINYNCARTSNSFWNEYAV